MNSHHAYPHRTIDMKELKRCGRGIRRLVTLCGTITQLVLEYDRWLLRPVSNGDDGGDDDDNGNGDEGDDDIPPEKREEVRRSVFQNLSLIRTSHD